MYKEKLVSPYWQRKRLEVFNRDQFKCTFCGNTEEELHVHHVKYIPGRQPWEYNDNDFSISLCATCHSDEERLRDEDPHLIGMFSLTGLSRRELYSLAAELRRHLRNTPNKGERFQDLMSYLYNG